MIDTDRYVPLRRVSGVKRTRSGLRADLDGEELQVDAVGSDVLRIRISRGGAFEESPTFAVCVDPLANVPSFSLEVDEEAGVARLRTDALTLLLGLDPFRVDVHRTDGSAVIETAVDDDGRPCAYATLNDAFVIKRRCRQEDAFYGLGEKGGRFNRKGRDFTGWNTDVLNPWSAREFTAGRPAADPRSDKTSTEYDPYYVWVPFFYHHALPSGAMAGSFVDNGFRAFYDFTAPEEFTLHFAGGQYTEYVFGGPRMPDILEAYTRLTGRMSVPPLWTLGYHQCRWFRYSQDAVEALGRRHRELGIPCDALWLDIEYMDGYRVFTWDSELFGDPGAMLKRLASDGFRMVTIIDPGVKYEPGYAVYDSAVERDVLCRTEGGDTYLGQVWPGTTAFPDFVSAAGRRWWGELNAEHVRSGLAGIWNDMNEPATGDVLPGAMRFDSGRYAHERYHNQYALLMAVATTEGLREAMPDLRTFVLSRSGFAGIQRVAANWMGDNQSRWDHLWVSMPMAAGFGVSGQPFVGADAGGFQGNSNPELFLRWMQYGVLTPFCRNHSEMGNVDQYAWSFGDVVLDLVRDAIRLRYRLLPYLYACFLQAAETGAPVQRPLVFDSQDDPLLAETDDEFRLGPDLLVAPVIAPGTTARQVYLPEGRWYDWHTDEPVDGRRFLLVPTPMDRIPIYVRAGAVIPMWPEAPPSTDGYHPAAIELHLFVPDDDGGGVTSLLQEDDGLTFAASEGARYRTTFRTARSGSRVELVAEVDGDGYPEFARTEFRLHVHGGEAAMIEIDGGEPHESSDGPVRIPNAGTRFQAVITLSR